jgi:hypothetical protein
VNRSAGGAASGDPRPHAALGSSAPPGGPRSPRASATRGAGTRASAARLGAWRAPLPTAALVLLGLVLYARGLVLGYVGDDLTLLDAALRYPLGELLSGRHGIVGYYRPVSRELYFWGWGRLAGLGPGGFHLVNALTFAATLLMIERLGRAWVGPRAGFLAAAAFLLFPPGSALLAWISCAQDLIMVFWAVGALLLYQHGRHAAAGVATALAALSKETAVVLPAALAVMDWQLHAGATWSARLRRLAPALVGLGAAVAVSVAVRASWPAGTAVTIWAPRQFVGAWRLPLDFARTLLPPDTGAGIALALEAQPVWLALVAGLAAFAVPWEASSRPAPAPASLGGARPGSIRQGAARMPSLVVFGLALLLLAMLPIGFVVERWRGYFFSLSAVGGALALGVLLARLAPPLTRGLLALAAVLHFGAGGVYRPLETEAGPARHPHVNYAFFRDTGELSDGLLAALAPWCASIGALPRTFVAGVPPEQVFETAIGPGLRVTCRDTVPRVRFLADFTTADARSDFGVLRFDPRTGRFTHERADARVRARVGEGFLIHTQFAVAAACFEAAAGLAPNRELSYPLAVTLAAAGRGAEARTTWRDAVRRGAVLDPDTMAHRLAASVAAARAAGPDSARPAGPGSARPGGTAGAAAARERKLVPLSAAALREPWEAGPHRALGRALLELGLAREATFELAAAAGIGRGNPDLAWLAQGYEAMGLTDEAVVAYRRALEVGLAGDLYATTRDRFVALTRQDPGALDRSRTRP